MRCHNRNFAKSQQLTLTAFFCLTLTACTGSTTVNTGDPISNGTSGDISSPVENSVVLITRQSGGCIRLGPNCAVHKLYVDGTVNVQRTPDGATEATGQIDTGLLNNWRTLVAMTDFAELRARLPAGQCAGCVDGVDFEYEISTAEESVAFSSIEFRFDNTEPFFALTNGLYEAMQNAAPLDSQVR